MKSGSRKDILKSCSVLAVVVPSLLTVVVFGEAGFEAEAGVTILHFCAGLLWITKQVVARLGSCWSKNNYFYRKFSFSSEISTNWNIYFSSQFAGNSECQTLESIKGIKVKIIPI